MSLWCRQCQQQYDFSTPTEGVAESRSSARRTMAVQLVLSILIPGLVLLFGVWS